MTNRTFSIIKPDAVGDNNIGNICTMIEKLGFRIIAMQMACLNLSEVEKFYAIHKDRPFFKNLCTFMTAGPIVAMVLEKENAIADFRKLVGATDPAESDEGTIRKLYAANRTINAVHASDSDENAAIEASFFFSEKDIVTTKYIAPVFETYNFK